MTPIQKINHNRIKELFKLIDNYFESTNKPLSEQDYKQFESIAEREANK